MIQQLNVNLSHFIVIVTIQQIEVQSPMGKPSCSRYPIQVNTSVYIHIYRYIHVNVFSYLGMVLGANFGSGHMVNSNVRKIVPTLIKVNSEDPKRLIASDIHTYTHIRLHIYVGIFHPHMSVSFVIQRSLSVQVAHQYGRWIILNKADPLGTVGETVNQSDFIMLEQEWNFIGSSSPYDCYMQTGDFPTLQYMFIDLCIQCYSNHTCIHIYTYL